MSSETSQVKTPVKTSRPQAKARRASSRSAMLRCLSLEALEQRTLMAVLPSSTLTGAIAVSASSGNQSTPTITIDQNNPQKLAAVWTRNDPLLAPGPTEIVQYAVSNDAGKSWIQEGAPGGFSFPASFDPTTNSPILLFPQYNTASIAFDRNDNFYILYSGHKTDNTAGVLLLSKYDFSTGAPQTVFTNQVIDKWTGDQASSPTLAVDDSLPTFSDVDSNGVTITQNDPNSGNVYIAWQSTDVAPAYNPSNFNPDRIEMVTSTDGGQTFSPVQILNDNGNYGANRNVTPRIALSQGSAPRAAGTNSPSDPGSPGVSPGQVSVVWDDYGVGALAIPPFDRIVADRITGPTSSTSLSTIGPIGDAIKGAGSTDTPTTTPFKVNVNITDPRFLSISDITASVALTDPSLAVMKLVLVPPTGSNLPSLTLLNNQTDASGNTNAFTGVTGNALGVVANGDAVGTIFDDNATRDIVDFTNAPPARGAAAPFIGHFRPEAGSFSQYDGAIAGAPNSPNSVNGQWTLQVTVFRNGNAGNLRNFTLSLVSGFIPQVNTVITDTSVRAIASGGQTASPATAQGIAPDPVIASDNTLGAYSPYQGRLYVEFVDRYNINGSLPNPLVNTDIFLATSDDGGLTWTRSPAPVNDDLAIKDGFSEGGGDLFDPTTNVYNNSGRSQLQPSITVDNATGTVVSSWYDLRYDANQSRVATFLTTSIDGGRTFSPDVFTNTPQTATDAITGKTIVLGPIPDNQSGGNAEAVAGFGSHQSIAAYGGHAYPVWSSNLNGGGDAKAKLQISTNVALFGAGPRVIASTQGPIGLPNDTVNASRGADGGPIASAFQVTFDRPIDPSTFNTNDVQVLYRDTTPTNVTGGAVPVNSVVPLDSGPLGATRFQVNFAPRSGVGTYSIAITGTHISDRIRNVVSAVTPVGARVSSSSSNVPITVAPSGTIQSNLTIAPLPAGQVVSDVTVTLSITAPDASSLTLTLISPSGSRILLANREPFPFAGGQDYSSTTFSDQASLSINQGFAPFSGSFRPVSSLAQLAGQVPGGTWRLEVTSSQSPLSATLTSWSLSIQPGVVAKVQVPGNKLDQNVTAGLGGNNDYYATPNPVAASNPLVNSNPFVGPFSQDTLPLILPGPHVQSTSIPGQPAKSDNLVLNAPVAAIDVTFDRNMNPATITPATFVSFTGPAGSITGPFTIQANPNGSDPDPAHPRTYRVSFPAQSLSGTYTANLASTITDSHGNALDTNSNAGLDLLRGTVSGPTNTVTYNDNTSAPIPVAKTVVSTLNIPDNFLAQKVTVQINITFPFDPDLQITLVSPNNIPIILVARGTGNTGTKANFSGTTFDDLAPTLITNGGPPFFGSFKPQFPLSALNGIQTAGVWKLIVDNNPSSTSGSSGVLTSWSLGFQKGIPSSDLGEPVADLAPLSFRIFNSAATNPLASTTWTPVGPASSVQTGVNNGYAGRVGGIALDPSDPSGNTAYVAGASGGVWKTANFLTTSANGPTYIPLTDFGPTSSLNIGSIAVFGRNNDPRQSIIIAGTGEGATTYNSTIGGNTSQGVGFIISKNGGATWQLLDSTNNNLPFASRDHLFAGVNGAGLGTSTMKVVIDPRPTPDGNAIIYAALTGNQGGLWRSVDTGQTWTRLSAAGLGNASDVLLDYTSATVDALGNPVGNVNIIYAAFPGSGVYISPNRGQVLNLMAGGNVDPLIFDTLTNRQVPVNNGSAAPTGAAGGSRIVLAKPTPLASTANSADIQNTLYEGWLYAAVSNSSGHLDGVYLTKDYGQTWTKLQILGLPDNSLIPRRAVPTNDNLQGQYDVLGSRIFQNGSYDLALSVDPTNPNIFYLGGTANGQQTGLIRVDTTGVYDSHAVVSYDGNRDQAGAPLQINTTGRAQVDSNIFGPSAFVGTSGAFSFARGPYLNLLADPTSPFQTNSTIFVRNVSSFTNDGTGVKWTPIDQILQSNPNDFVPSTNVHQILSIVDPLTGHARLIIGDDQGVFTGVINADGTINPGISNAVSPTYSRNGNLQITQDYYGAAQPSNTLLNSQIASALFYGNSFNLGMTASDPNILNNGNIAGQDSTSGATLGVIAATSGDQAGTGIAVDQQGRNIVYRYLWPAYGGNGTDFFQVSVGGGPFISRTSGLVQTALDPQWPGYSPVYPGGSGVGNSAVAFGNFAINPIAGDQIMISSNAGRIFATTDQGAHWLSIGEPGALDGSYAPALTFGAADPNGPGGIGNLNNFLYAGTVSGRIFVTQTGGGAIGGGNAWTNISSGLDGSPVLKIIANPTRGNHEAYAVTQKGVYYTPNSITSPTWTNITGNLFALTNTAFGDPTTAQAAIAYLTSIQTDYRYVIPNGGTSTGTHPLLYASGNTGVYRSIDNGVTWTSFPNQSFDNAPVDGGYLPHAAVTDLSVSLGKIDPTTGRAVAVPGDPNVLLASTFGRGQFSIKLAPIVFPSFVALDAKLPLPSGSVSGTDSLGRPIVTVAQPVIDGLSEQTAFGNKVRITLIDLTDPANPRIVGGYDPSNPATDIAANQTNTFGKFQIQVNPTGFTTNGVKTIGIQATDGSGTEGNIATLTFVLNAKLVSPTAPAAPTIGLDPLDDTSGGNNITSNTSPHIIGNSDPGVQIQVFIRSFNGVASNIVIGTVTSDSLGNYRVQMPANSADGAYIVQAVATNTFGSTSGLLFTFSIKTTPPTTVPTLTLSPADDTGVLGDNITSVRLPHFVGTADPNAKISIYKVVNNVPVTLALATVTANSVGKYSVQLPFALLDGSITLAVRESDPAGNVGNYSAPLSVTIVSVLADYNNAAKTTPAVFRRTAGTALWLIQGVSPVGGFQYGNSNLDVPFTGDFDGDGKADLAYYQPSTSEWFINRSSSGPENFVLGAPGAIPAVGIFNTNGVTDPAVYNANTGVWNIADPSNGLQTISMVLTGFTPQTGDIPVPGNYDGPAKSKIDELAVYRPATGQFFVRSPDSANPGSFLITTTTLSTGTAGDIPVPGNYDFVQQTDYAVYNPTTESYLIKGPAANRTVSFSSLGDPNLIPAPGDYLGLGTLQPTVFSPKTAQFVINNNNAITTITYASAGDIPVTSPLYYRNIVSKAPTLALDPGSDTGVPGDNVTSARQPFFNGQTDPGASVDLIDPTNNNAILGSGVADANGNFKIQISAGANLPNGSYTVQARAHGIATSQGPTSPAIVVKLVTVDGDYLGISSTQTALIRRTSPTDLAWFVHFYGPVNNLQFGQGSLDVPLAGDFTGAGKTDLAYYEPSTGNWVIATPANGYASQTLLAYGGGMGDVPVPADYTGAGKVVPAVYKPGNGTWYISGLLSPTIITSPAAGDIPVPANYDNTGKAELAVFRPAIGQWIIQGPSSVVHTVNFGGNSADVPVPGAYDASPTSQAAEPAFWRPITGQYFIRTPGGGTRILQFAKGDIPAPGDYDGSGLTEPAVYRPSTATFYVWSLNDAAPRAIVSNFGGANFIPTLSPYLYRALPTPGKTLPSSGISSSAVAPDLGATARSFANGATSLTPAPAASPVGSSLSLGTRSRPQIHHNLHGSSHATHRTLLHHVAAKKGH